MSSYPAQAVIIPLGIRCGRSSRRHTAGCGMTYAGVAPPRIERPQGSVPVLLITGADDVENFRVIAEFIAGMGPDVRRVDLMDTGHLAHLERPAEVAAEIGAFLIERVDIEARDALLP
ncbi:alpha/beta fold hydrolase [Rhodococcus sp. NPDC060090]|uniref:alpha/beta fold hydrolase n=1 Tax=Rhodococcus sp. NPDC060090 TaxID=3347056 RepID=UPI003653D3AF